MASIPQQQLDELRALNGRAKKLLEGQAAEALVLAEIRATGERTVVLLEQLVALGDEPRAAALGLSGGKVEQKETP